MRTIGAMIFPGFELLDLFGPLEMFGMLEEDFAIRLVAQKAGLVASAQGPQVLAEDGFAEGHTYDILLVPGGPGTRREVDNPLLCDWLAQAAEQAEYVLSVCTGSALLARAGLLDERRATSNKAAFGWVREQGPEVTWVEEARWVEDGNIFTSSGVSAGMDMALGTIERMQGREAADKVARFAEYSWHDDKDRDPFAALYGLGNSG